MKILEIIVFYFELILIHCKLFLAVIKLLFLNMELLIILNLNLRNLYNKYFY